MIFEQFELLILQNSKQLSVVLEQFELLVLAQQEGSMTISELLVLVPIKAEDRRAARAFKASRIGDWLAAECLRLPTMAQQ